MEQDVRPPRRDQVDDRRRRDIEAMEREPPVRQRPRRREVAERTAREVVDDVDLPIFGEQAVDQCRPDEPGAARDERLHGHSRSAGIRPPEILVPPITVMPAPTIVSPESATSGLSTA